MATYWIDEILGAPGTSVIASLLAGGKGHDEEELHSLSAYFA